MKKFRFRGKTYAWNWEDSQLYKAGIITVVIAGMLLMSAGLWATICLATSFPLE